MALAQPSNVIRLGGDKKTYNLVEGVAEVNRLLKIIVPMNLADKILTSSEPEFVEAKRRLATSNDKPVAAGSLIVYVGPDQPFGEIVRVENVLFKVPKDYQTAKNSSITIPCGLADGKPMFEFVKEGNDFSLYVPDENRIKLFEDFPKTFGATRLNSDGCVQGEASISDADAKWIFRTIKNITFGQRAEGLGFYGERAIDLAVMPSAQRDFLVFEVTPS
jgi:hypothetical protein